MTEAQDPQDAREREPPAAAGGKTGAASQAEQALVELLRRERADFLNYRRRVEQERAADRERARLELVRELLPLLDGLDRALAEVPQGGGRAGARLRRGVRGLRAGRRPL